MSASVLLVNSADSFESALASAKAGGGGLCLLHFRADWAAQCAQMSSVMDELARDSANAGVTFVNVEAEQVPQVTSRFGVVAVPTFILLRCPPGQQQQPQVADRLNGADPAALAAKLAKAVAAAAPAPAPPPPAESQEQLEARLKSILARSPVMLFMKGSPDSPKCGFSRQIVELLKRHSESAPFDHFDILQDQAVRDGLKKLSNWPTYPQLYANGQLLGGLDVVREMEEAGELGPALKSAVTARLESLINGCRVMLFMKGSPDSPKCGFSRQIVELLRSESVEFGHFDILQDQTVREALKRHSNWPTYPQLYANGQLLGGLDVVREMQQAGELKAAFGATC